MPFGVIRFFSEYGEMIFPASGGIILTIVGALAGNWKKTEKHLKTAGIGVSVCLALFMLWYVSENNRGAFRIEDALFPDDYPALYRDSYYVGQVKNGQAIGEGKLFDAKTSRLVYSGSFDENRISEGTFYYENGDYYTGTFKDDKRDGEGAYYWADSAAFARYEGRWKSDQRNGWGVMYYSSHDESQRERYEGTWVNGIREGHGTLYWKSGSWYDGQWVANKRKGQGNYHYWNGNRYYGEFENDHPNGYGVFYYANGKRYEGELTVGHLNGHGALYYANGDRYEGEWNNEKPHGAGVYYYADGRSEAREYKNGERIS